MSAGELPDLGAEADRVMDAVVRALNDGVGTAAIADLVPLTGKVLFPEPVGSLDLVVDGRLWRLWLQPLEWL
jgi:hypothetical protein